MRNSLKEDKGRRDITTEWLIPEGRLVKAIILAKENCVACGLDIAKFVFKVQDKRIKFKSKVSDGQRIKKGRILARIEGNARSILIAERVALNFLGLLSGIATKTRTYVEAVRPPVRKSGKRRRFCNGVKIMDTRKTLPGLRELEKYAVRIGGGYNHRMRLDEMFLIKDNHLKVIGNRLKVKGLENTIQKRISKKFEVEIEVSSLKEFRRYLQLKPNIIMLDNMSIKDMKKAVQLRDNLSPFTLHPLPKLEASGGINLKNIRKVAATGVEMISVGDLTHSVESVDVSLEIL